jgi:hypothetical protein
MIRTISGYTVPNEGIPPYGWGWGDTPPVALGATRVFYHGNSIHQKLVFQ